MDGQKEIKADGPIRLKIEGQISIFWVTSK